MKKSILSKILQYEVPERIILVEDIWDSIAQCPEAIPVTDSQLKELDRRLEAYRSNPKGGSPWDVVKKRIKNHLNESCYYIHRSGVGFNRGLFVV